MNVPEGRTEYDALGRLLYATARMRVESDAQLAPHADFIFADWHEGDEHLLWVIKAPVEEILSWVEAGDESC